MEIERKFLVKTPPDLSNLKPISYERYFIFNNNEIEIRIQRKGDKFELERKAKQTELSSLKQKIEISQNEFDYFKNFSAQSIVRDSYIINDNPQISIKIYHGNYKGLIRVEVEFENEQEAEHFNIPDWFGKEITDTPLGKDSKLIMLSNEEFCKIIQSLNANTY